MFGLKSVGQSLKHIGAKQIPDGDIKGKIISGLTDAAIAGIAESLGIQDIVKNALNHIMTGAKNTVNVGKKFLFGKNKQTEHQDILESLNKHTHHIQQ